MYLEKNKGAKMSSSEQKIEHSLASIHPSKNNSPSYFWVVSKSNSNFGSRKSMRLEHKEDVAKLISKNKLEIRSKVGKDNTLLIYAVYNKSKFMNKQFRNPKYYESAEKSTFFNTEPFYTSDIKNKKTTKP